MSLNGAASFFGVLGDAAVSRRYGFITCRKLLTGLGSGFGMLCSLSLSQLAVEIGGTGGASLCEGTGGAWSAEDFLRRRKKDDDFFCSVGWFECEEVVSREGGAEPVFWVVVCVPLLLGLSAPCSTLFNREDRFESRAGALALEEPPPKTRLKKPGRSFGTGVAAGDAAFGLP